MPNREELDKVYAALRYLSENVPRTLSLDTLRLYEEAFAVSMAMEWCSRYYMQLDKDDANKLLELQYKRGLNIMKDLKFTPGKN